MGKHLFCNSEKLLFPLLHGTFFLPTGNLCGAERKMAINRNGIFFPVVSEKKTEIGAFPGSKKRDRNQPHNLSCVGIEKGVGGGLDLFKVSKKLRKKEKQQRVRGYFQALLPQNRRQMQPSTSPKKTLRLLLLVLRRSVRSLHVVASFFRFFLKGQIASYNHERFSPTEAHDKIVQDF